ncbi:uncharacterized protein A1O9_06336 [Exophiala aquamarina CBS 119918]|uniref:Transcription factor domain-containing protein n=1 Tax=Exophiala aquamarina CBS 119918 TaxID=1182545 RepID=A0A072PSC0_9EURO|nr:uncharacterized protein A1O9_06336 [Exophiala aquamarina CBS 119918]KEF58410.1 hypothetical protein A1O9_06336 [Exophiala aquamarina CBS 119918]
MQIAHILNLGSHNKAKGNPLEAELSRRRFWACHLINCHSSESMFAINPPDKIAALPLPWCDSHFDCGKSEDQPVYLDSDSTNGGIYSELIKGMTIWSSVNTLIKSSTLSQENRQAAIYEHDTAVKKWWRGVPDSFRLTPTAPTNLATFDRVDLMKIVMINTIYLQSLCALHSSIVPLFSWGPSNLTSEMAQHFSAQVAYHNACLLSELLGMYLEYSTDMAGISSYIGFAAYCSFAIQVPFIKCLNPTVKERAKRNTAINLRVIRGLSEYWRFMTLVERYASYLTKTHLQNDLNLEDEPKGLDPGKLTGFRMNASRARASILSLNTILWKDDGYTVEGDEVADIGPCDSNESPEQQFPSEVLSYGSFAEQNQGQPSLNHYNPLYNSWAPNIPGVSDISGQETSDLFQPLLISSEMFASEDLTFFEDPPLMNPTFHTQNLNLDDTSFDLGAPFLTRT